MHILIVFVGFAIYGFFAMVLFVNVGIRMAGDEGGLVGFVLCILIAGYGGGFIASMTPLMGWIFRP